MTSAIYLVAMWAVATPSSWRTLQPGVEYRTIQLSESPRYGDGLLYVVRVDTSKAELVVQAASDLDRRNRTAAEWADEFDRVAVINAGMYERNHSVHTGYLRIGRHVNNQRWVEAYKSALVVDRPRARIIDVMTRPSTLDEHDVVVQNLRLIADPGKNVWAENNRQWSEAALAMDDQGRILFLFTRTPYSMRQLNRRLLQLGLGITHAHHLEGGPEASLSVRGPGLKLDLSGSYETGFFEDDSNREQWRLPNVIAIKRSQPN